MKHAVDELREKLGSKGFNPAQVNTIIDVLAEGLPLSIDPTTFELKAGKCKITFLDSKGEVATGEEGEPLRAYSWMAEIEGLDPSQIQSVEIPRLEYSKPGVFSIKVSIIPFKVPCFQSSLIK